jgi:hypothetical protein
VAQPVPVEVVETLPAKPVKKVYYVTEDDDVLSVLDRIA